MGKIRILYVLNDMLNGGTEAFVMNYYRALDRKIFDIEFLIMSARNNYYENEIVANGDTVHDLAQTNSGYNYFLNMKKIYDFFHFHKYDIIHIHSCSLKFLWQVSKIARINKSGLIIGHAHSTGDSKRSIMELLVRFILKHSISNCLDYGMACSKEAAAAKYTSDFINSPKYFFVPNAIDTNKYSFDETKRNAVRSKLGLQGKYVVGIVGRVERLKNQAILIDALQIAINKMDVYLIIIGDGDERRDLEKKVKELNIEKNVIFTGAINNVADYYSAMDLFCLPSYIEGFPFVLVEAQANGLKCLISDKVSRETDISQASEYLPIDNAEVWANRIIENINQRLSTEEIQEVKEKFDINYATKNLQKFYIKVVRKN